MNRQSAIARQEAGLWFYRCQVVRVVDGDTILLRLDLGFHVELVEPVRLDGINTPELIGADADKAREAKRFVEEWLAAEGQLYVQTRLIREREKFGRILGTIWRAGDLVSLNQALLEGGHAKEMS